MTSKPGCGEKGTEGETVTEGWSQGNLRYEMVSYSCNAASTRLESKWRAAHGLAALGQEGGGVWVPRGALQGPSTKRRSESLARV